MSTLDLGKILRSIREDFQLTQSELGDLINVSQAKISKMEQGQTVLTLSEWLQLTDCLQIGQDPRDYNGKKTYAFNSRDENN